MSVRHLFLAVLTAMAAVTTFPAGSTAATAAAGAPRLMGAVEFASDNLAALPQWTRVLAKWAKEKPVIARCDRDPDACTSPMMIAWRAKVQELQSRSPMDQMLGTNIFVNTWRHKESVKRQGGRHRWASPLEFLGHAGGTEGFAIMKFFMLRDLGFSNDALRVVVAKDVLRNKTHTFLAVYLGGKIYVLDNISNTVLTQDRANYYFPFYSVNETTRWAYIADTKPGGLAIDGRN